MTDPIDDSPLLSPSEIKQIQCIIGKFWYYGRGVDPTAITPLSSLAREQAKATSNTAAAITKFLNYLYTNSNAKIRYYASDMILKIHSDSSYLNESQARSQYGSHFYLGNDTTNNGRID